MAIVVTCEPRRIDKGHVFTPEILPVAKGCELAVGGEAFIWFTNKKNSGGLAACGTLVSFSSEGGRRFSLAVELYASKPTSELSDWDLAKYDLRKSEVTERPGDPRHRLCEKLYAYSPRRVIGLELDEAEFLRGHFNGAVVSGNEQQRLFQSTISVPNNSQETGETSSPEGDLFGSDVDKLIDEDLCDWALEGLSVVQKAKRRQRAYKLALRFINDRLQRGSFFCDACTFDPITKTRGTSINPRSLLDVHHINPLTDGVRKSRLTDFRLLCPNCHRFEHALLRERQ
jgi:hypothetical protein